MKWSIQELNKFKEKGIDFNEELNLKDNLMARDSDIIDVAPLHVSGHLAINNTEYIIYGKVQVSITVPSTRSLEPVEVPLSFDFDEVYMTKEQFANRTSSDQDDFIMILEKDYIDLDAVVEDYVLLNIPSHILSDEELNAEDLPSGHDWEVISEDEYMKRVNEQAEETINPQMAKLKSLLNSQDD